MPEGSEPIGKSVVSEPAFAVGEAAAECPVIPSKSGSHPLEESDEIDKMWEVELAEKACRFRKG